MNIVSHVAVAPGICASSIFLWRTLAGHALGSLTHSRGAAEALFFADSEFNGTTLIIVIAVVIVVAVLSAISAKKQREALEKAATEMGFSFDRNGDALVSQLSANLHLFELGHSRTFYNVSRGSCGTGEVALFEFQYTERGAYNSQTGVYSQSKHHQTVAAFKFPNTKLPDFRLDSKGWWNKVEKLFGRQTITFDTHPQFGERYSLRGSREEAIREFFRPSVLAYLQSMPAKPEWTIEAASPWLLVYVRSRLTKPAELREFRDTTAAIASNIMAGAETWKTAKAG